MNIHVEDLPNCQKTIRVEASPDEVRSARGKIVDDYRKHARLPGYRPGKAPASVIERKFQKDISEETEREILRESSRKAIAEHKLRTISIQAIDDLKIQPDDSLHFTITVVAAPDFELPEYKGIEVEVPTTEVSGNEVDDALENLRNEYADFNDITDRGLEMGDFAVIDYVGEIDEKPVHEVFPKAGKPLSSNSNFWIRLTPEAFFPGFAEALLGAKLNDERKFEITVPVDFAVEEMRGQTIGYSVTVRGLKSKQLPELDDAFAARVIEGKTLDELREVVRDELKRRKESEAEGQKRAQIMEKLCARVEFELPEGMVRNQTRRILTDIVRENQARGIADEVLKEHEKDLVMSASQNARERLKGTFILTRIADAEKIQVTERDLQQRVAMLAAQYGMGMDKMFKELRKHDALHEIQEELLTGKALDFLVSHASVRSAPATA